MKITILNECFFELGHINRLKKLGEVKIYKNTVTEEEVIERLKDSDIGIIDMFIAPITKRVLDNCKNIKLIAVNSTGFEKVDGKYARKNNISLSNIPNFSTDAVAEQTIALLFAVNRKIVIGDRDFRHSLLEIDPGNEKQKKYLGSNIKGKTIGIIGCGNIGTRVAQLAQGLGMIVLAYNRTKKTIQGVKFVELKQLLKESDIISINLAYNKETEHLIGAEELALMQPKTILINTCHEGIIDTEALYNSLKNRKIGGAGLDTFKGTKEHPLLELENVVFSPHSAWYTFESLRNIADILTTTVESFSKGKPINIVN